MRLSPPLSPSTCLQGAQTDLTSIHPHTQSHTQSRDFHLSFFLLD